MQEWTKLPVFAHEHHEEFAEKGAARRGAIQAQSKIEILLIINRGEAQHGQLSVEESISVNSRQIGRVAERWKFVAVCDVIGAPVCNS